jgi:hypothetical protein
MACALIIEFRMKIADSPHEIVRKSVDSWPKTCRGGWFVDTLGVPRDTISRYPSSPINSMLPHHALALCAKAFYIDVDIVNARI